jgi:hypothetical protein
MRNSHTARFASTPSTAPRGGKFIPTAINMKLFKEGGKSKAICSSCKAVVSTTFKYRDVPFSDGIGFAKNILVSVCDCCDQVVATPPQSTPAIRLSRAKALKSVEAIVPSTLIDAINLAAYTVDPDFSQEFKKKALWFFVRDYAKTEYEQALKIKNNYLESAVEFGDARGASRGRISFKVSAAMFDDLQKAAEIFGENQTETLKIAAFDFFKNVVEFKNNRLISKLKDIAYMA